MLRTLLATAFLFFSVQLALAQQTIFGNVTDETGEPVIAATVAVLKGDNLVTGDVTDFDGNYRISVDAGTYNIRFSYTGQQTSIINDFVVQVGKENKLDFKFEAGGVNLDEIVVTEYKIPPMTVDETTQGAIISSEEIRKLGSRNINAIAAIAAGATSADEGSAISVRGGRTDATQYVIDGIRVTGGALVPETEIEQLEVITGGIEAKYGDVTGGIISITTKGPASRHSFYAEGESSYLLDPYNNNLVGLNASGPMVTRKVGDDTRTILGYRISGRYTYNEDDNAPATPVYNINEEAFRRLAANPVKSLPTGGFLTRATDLRPEDVEVLDAHPFNALNQTDITGKIDARLSDAMDITLSGTYQHIRNQFTPAASWRLLNSYRNPFDLDNTVRGNFRFRHRLGTRSSLAEQSTSGLISNAYYTIQLGFQRNQGSQEDQVHKDSLFNYGYIGDFRYVARPTYDITLDSVPDIRHDDYRIDYRGFTPGSENPILANYNLLGGEEFASNVEQFPAVNGTLASLITNGAYDLHTSLGTVYNRNAKNKNDLMTFNLQAQFDLQPGGSAKGNHNVQIGVLAEQRINRSYIIAPSGLWQLAGQLANAGLNTLDTNIVLRQQIIDTTFAGFRIVDTVDIHPFEVPTPGSDAKFARALRESLGVPANQYVNVFGLRPDQLSLDMFSAPELTRQGLVSYAGYDYLGNEISNNFAWEDFFTATDADGIRTFPVAPLQPLYFSGYLQDKFTFSNIILRAGVRVDYFDANTKVLKDPYELYDIQTAGNFTPNENTPKPDNIPDDAKVYVEAEGSDRVKAYRVNDTWFTAEGRQVNRAAEIFTATQVPVFVDPNATRVSNYIQDESFDPNASFTDYEAQINVMPRLSFSFPISEKANFFAHYDVLVQRPPSNTTATAADYFFLSNSAAGGGVINNPNLKPTRTIDYEAGFQARVTPSSALKMSFFVREMRDLIQRQTYLFALGEVGQYTTFGNQDFGTVKGFNLSYDLRRTGPFQMRMAYALQFADGTGSDANSQRGSAQRGNLRTLYPLSYDERHRFSGSLDYRYGRNEGPELFGRSIFANTGINLFGSAVSGRPYTRLQTPTQLGGRVNEGDINGARLPWNLALNLRIDRDFQIFRDEASNRRGSALNVYLRVSNLLDRRNIIAVYPATGLPNDDGFLASQLGEIALAGQLNQDLYIQSYNYRLLNPDLYSLPRRIFLGASINF